ncbi:hypothetical protein DM02DRAFT_569418 [Periconia macrospinosa]|uniref:HCNGP-domain-containing protein n=1 Tax=Periconia macrospinosa TaxID=97972 RepID=A0A2V1DER7_9PLEO|nr:hypothetical protein DM02DRAFT_569418 [Periconia macrospinosa]
MLGIDYESSDEEELVIQKQTEAKSSAAAIVPATTSPPASTKEDTIPAGPVDGPSQGPSVPLDTEQDAPADIIAPGSPYTSNRLTIQNLTLPIIPNWDIPPSPPGSPPQKATKKFTQFLELKKKGQHFNSRLETSSVLRDPNHPQKLNNFAGISEVDQYASVLPEEVGVPVIWPTWAYGDELNATQKKMKANVNRGPVSFVPANSKSSNAKSTLSVRAAQESSQNSRKRKEVD